MAGIGDRHDDWQNGAPVGGDTGSLRTIRDLLGDIANERAQYTTDSSRPETALLPHPLIPGFDYVGRYHESLLEQMDTERFEKTARLRNCARALFRAALTREMAERQAIPLDKEVPGFLQPLTKRVLESDASPYEIFITQRMLALRALAVAACSFAPGMINASVLSTRTRKGVVAAAKSLGMTEAEGAASHKIDVGYPGYVHEGTRRRWDVASFKAKETLGVLADGALLRCRTVGLFIPTAEAVARIGHEYDEQEDGAGVDFSEVPHTINESRLIMPIRDPHVPPPNNPHAAVTQILRADTTAEIIPLRELYYVYNPQIGSH